MAEKVYFTPEHDSSSETFTEEVSQAERLIEATEHAPEELSAEDITRLETAVHENAKQTAEIKPHTQEKTPAMSGTLSQHKKQAYKSSMRHIQSKLKPRERSFSKIIHQPVVDKASAITAKTLARPSGMLGGGIFALVGSCILLFASRRYGFEYNYFAYVLLLAVGYVVGSLAEVLVRVFQRN